MKQIIVATSLLVLAASPAAARDRAAYFGVSGGILFPRDNQASIFADYTTIQTPATPAAPAGPADVLFGNAIRIDYKRGYDLDATLGYDFGLLRAEVEASYKQADLDGYEIDSATLASLSTALNRPSSAPDPFAPGAGALTADDSNVDGRVRVLSAMLNVLLDVGNDDGLSLFAGGGLGRARVKLLGNRDDEWAGQLLAGARYAISDNIDVGLKYRYFRTRRLELSDSDTSAVVGNPNLFNLGTPSSPVFVEQTVNAALDTRFSDRFESHSLLASLTFNFGARRAPEPMNVPASASPPPPPPAPPPATQTCSDGSVVLATDACPVPPPPPPPPPPEPVRG